MKIWSTLIATFAQDLTESPTPLFFPLFVFTSDLVVVVVSAVSAVVVSVNGFSKTHFNLDSIKLSGSTIFHFEKKIQNYYRHKGGVEWRNVHKIQYAL